jgi:hypothetical protein
VVKSQAKNRNTRKQNEFDASLATRQIALGRGFTFRILHGGIHPNQRAEACTQEDNERATRLTRV